MLDLGYTNLNQKAFNETGAGPMNLEIQSGNNYYFVLNPSLEFGSEIVSGDVVFRPRLAVGYIGYYGEANLNAKFQGAPGDASSFINWGTSDSNYLSAGLGLDVLFQNGMSVELSYTGQYSENTSNQSVGASLSIPF
jgi:uncharacterized protein with beta-barrel porin domain